MQDRTEVHKQRVVVDGLEEEVEILVDRHGVAHIYARCDGDVFLAQGFNAARDRLWQLDLWRRRGLGLMAEAFGADFVERDRAARLLLFRGDMDREWAAYGEQARAWTEAFARGINAYVALTEAEPERLPLEFVALGLTPARWSAEDVVRCRGHARVRNLDTEVARANIAAAHGLAQAARVKGLEPPWPLEYPEGVTPEAIPPQVLHVYHLATTPTPLAGMTPEQLRAQAAGADGSNNWAVRPQRSTTGRAMLATDPHRLQELPSLRYTVHLNAPGLNVIGSGEPAIPGVSLGHNERIAFGLTIFPTDQEDLLVCELDPTDPQRVRYGDGYEALQAVRERIPVRGEEAREVTLHFTRHGPVLHRDPDRGRAYALRTVWSEPGTAAYMASLRYLRAGTWEDFVAAQSGWGAPSVNHVYADVDGNVGWITAGLLPVRPNWDGLLPVPGDGRFEWQGFMDPSLHPREFNPPRGWVASANQMNLPRDFDHARHRTGFEFAHGGRHRRIAEVLGSRERHSLADFQALQADVRSPDAVALLEALQDCAPMDGDAARARALLADWSRDLDADSAAAALFEIWFTHHLIPHAQRSHSPEAVIEQIPVPDPALLVPEFVAGARPEDWAQTLAAAWSEAVTRLGPDPATWAWGRLHRAHLHHPLGPSLGPALARRLDIGPLPKSGSGLTVNNNGYRPADFEVVHGVSWRMVADVGNWDACRFVNSPGQSGDPSSPHYADHFPVWAQESSLPLLFSRDAVEAAVRREIRLVPARAQQGSGEAAPSGE